MSRRRRPDRLGRRGGAAVEFGLIAPALLLLFVSVAEAVAYMRTWFRVDRVAAETVNVATQFDALTCSDISGLFDAAQTIAGTLNVTRANPLPGAGGRTILSAIGGQNGANTLLWQESRGDAEFASQLGTAATLPDRFIVPTGQTVLVVEAITGDRPWVFGASPAVLMTPPGPARAIAIMRPRTAQLSTPPGQATTPPRSRCT